MGQDLTQAHQQVRGSRRSRNGTPWLEHGQVEMQVSHKTLAEEMEELHRTVAEETPP